MVIIPRVAFSETLGVFLGHTEQDLMFARDKGRTGQEPVPLFKDQKEFDEYRKEHHPGLWPLDIQLKEVHPKGRKVATQEDCIDAGLPSWGR